MNYLQQLDLGYIRRKMCSPSYPLPRWQPELAATCEKLYKRFLWLIAKYPDERLVPTRDIDEFWHNHILYTSEYMHDCQAIVGKYIHHFPSDPDDEQELAKLVPQFKRTQEIYLQEFGEPLQVLVRD